MSSKLNQILKDYARKKDLAISNQRAKLEYVYNNIPRIKELDREISKTGILIAKSLLNDPDSYESSVLEVKQKMDKLKAEKAFLLTENNIPLDYLELEYECKSCGDSGFLKNGSKCACLKQALIRQGYRMSSIEQKLTSENFRTFNIELFSDQPFDGETTSPKENMLKILNTAEGFCLNFDKPNGENLLFYGSTGLGKTFLCNCIAKYLLDKGQLVIYQTAFKIMDTVQAHRFNKVDSSISKSDYNMLFEADLLIIDDLGTEFSNSFTITEFFNIINTRLLSGHKTLISTNLSLPQIRDIYTDRFFSRIASNFKMLKFYGPDLRWEEQQ